MSYDFTNSSAIRRISEVNECQVNITWTSGSSYTYDLSNAEQFMSNLAEIVSSGSSVGSFINSQIQQKNLRLVNT